MPKENVHKNHRQRLRNKFITGGLSGFDPHEVLELLLFYVLPQQDTNPIAHRLIEHFGSLSAVMDADIEELTRVTGIKEYSASILKLIPEISSYYNLDKLRSRVKFDEIQKIAEYCVFLHMKDVREKLSVFMLDNKYRFIGIKTMAEGAGCSVDINLELLATIRFKFSAPNFILVHNHPGGNPYPSVADIQITNYVYETFKPFNKTLLEHLIIAGKDYMPVMQIIKNQKTYI